MLGLEYVNKTSLCCLEFQGYSTESHYPSYSVFSEENADAAKSHELRISRG